MSALALPRREAVTYTGMLSCWRCSYGDAAIVALLAVVVAGGCLFTAAGITGCVLTCYSNMRFNQGVLPLADSPGWRSVAQFIHWMLLSSAACCSTANSKR
ncbi:MAG: hypothetical protein R3E95_17810 [Thiolinea sp.]